MVDRVNWVTLYLTYAAIMTALILCSVLSPIQVRTVGRRTLHVYGVCLVYHTPPSTWLEKSAGDDAASSSSEAVVERSVRITTPLTHMPTSTLARCMTAYLIFAAVCLLSCVALVVSLFVQLLPIERSRVGAVVTRAVTVLVPLAALLCFVMAAVLGLQTQLYSDVAAGFYTEARDGGPVGKLRSGFSSAAAAAIIGLIVVLLSPVFWKR
ncbi:hypothetical protein NESM_000502200 [Novymonas esmeraldas]|uniref:Uncharacterized protein n=1 Tax=Novymonas esmeraldas TaxID=1808958 RepID=A0AAW0ERE0_9TRYP